MASLLLLFAFFLKTISGTNETYCDETLECAGKDLNDAFLYCWGYNACTDSTIDNEFTECNGYAACFGTTMDVSGDIYCRSDQSCAMSDVSNTGNVYCGGYYGCAAMSTLESSGGVQCTGEAACRYTVITEASDGIVCVGDEACWFTKLTNVDSVFSAGYYSSTFIDIDTSDVDDFTMSLQGYKSGYGGQILCAEGSTCYIYCDQETSCDDLVLYCYGTCDVDCEGEDYECPTQLDYSTDSDSDSSDDEDNTAKQQLLQQYTSLRESRELLRIKHKQEFDLLLEELNDKNNKISHQERELKILKFNDYVETEMEQWKLDFKKLNKLNNENSYNKKELYVISSSIQSKSESAVGKNSFWNFKFFNESNNVVFGLSLMGNCLLMLVLILIVIKRKEKKAKEHREEYQLLK